MLGRALCRPVRSQNQSEKKEKIGRKRAVAADRWPGAEGAGALVAGVVCVCTRGAVTSPWRVLAQPRFRASPLEGGRSRVAGAAADPSVSAVKSSFQSPLPSISDRSRACLNVAAAVARAARGVVAARALVPWRARAPTGNRGAAVAPMFVASRCHPLAGPAGRVSTWESQPWSQARTPILTHVPRRRHLRVTRPVVPARSRSPLEGAATPLGLYPVPHHNHPHAGSGEPARRQGQPSLILASRLARAPSAGAEVPCARRAPLARDTDPGRPRQPAAPCLHEILRPSAKRRRCSRSAPDSLALRYPWRSNTPAAPVLSPSGERRHESRVSCFPSEGCTASCPRCLCAGSGGFVPRSG
nr:MAG: MC096L [Molluscum contagiosum virus]